MRKISGFTLVELLLVIAIIAILMGLLLPAIPRIMVHSLEKETKTVIRNLSLALKMYELDHSEFPPDGFRQDGTVIPQGIEGNVEGFFVAGQKSQYVDGALVRYLDGDASNDDDKTPSAPPIQYFEFDPEDTVAGIDSDHPIFLSSFGNAFFYNNLQNENRITKHEDNSNPNDPRHNFFQFRTFQIFNKGQTEDNPQSWISSFKE